MSVCVCVWGGGGGGGEMRRERLHVLLNKSLKQTIYNKVKFR